MSKCGRAWTGIHRCLRWPCRWSVVNAPGHGLSSTRAPACARSGDLGDAENVHSAGHREEQHTAVDVMTAAHNYDVEVLTRLHPERILVTMHHAQRRPEFARLANVSVGWGPPIANGTHGLLHEGGSRARRLTSTCDRIRRLIPPRRLQLAVSNLDEETAVSRPLPSGNAVRDAGSLPQRPRNRSPRAVA